MNFNVAKDYCAGMGFNVNLPMPKEYSKMSRIKFPLNDTRFLNSSKKKEEDDIIFHLTSPFMTKEAEDSSKPTPETYFWLGIYFHDHKWRYVDQVEAELRNWDNPKSNGKVGAIALGKLNESVCIYIILVL